MLVLCINAHNREGVHPGLYVHTGLSAKPLGMVCGYDWWDTAVSLKNGHGSLRSPVLPNPRIPPASVHLGLGLGGPQTAFKKHGQLLCISEDSHIHTYVGGRLLLLVE